MREDHNLARMYMYLLVAFIGIQIILSIIIIIINATVTCPTATCEQTRGNIIVSQVFVGIIGPLLCGGCCTYCARSLVLDLSTVDTVDATAKTVPVSSSHFGTPMGKPARVQAVPGRVNNVISNDQTPTVVNERVVVIP
eukprot:TRINITY_DN11314_c0_g1_i2.p1 TRINITY_DN11314_c0_g1~~TRINITY_DN11314_c0_g1_i2.p1  ORF type:complete len:139 (-),score=17.83 TRINITY_DN11314_c0_g1_i2:29-445(-)